MLAKLLPAKIRRFGAAFMNSYVHLSENYRVKDDSKYFAVLCCISAQAIQVDSLLEWSVLFWLSIWIVFSYDDDDNDDDPSGIPVSAEGVAESSS